MDSVMSQAFPLLWEKRDANRGHIFWHLLLVSIGILLAPFFLLPKQYKVRKPYFLGVDQTGCEAEGLSVTYHPYVLRLEV
jgi:hypothetical protein